MIELLGQVGLPSRSENRKVWIGKGGRLRVDENHPQPFFMFTDWLIWLDFEEEAGKETGFLRLVTPLIFGIKNNNVKKEPHHGFGVGYGDIEGNGSSVASYCQINHQCHGVGIGYNINSEFIYKDFYDEDD